LEDDVGLAPAINRNSPEARERRKAFATFARTGRVQAALQTSVDSGGGVFVPLEISNVIRENLVQVSQVRQVATIITASTDTVRIPKRTGASTAAWVTDGETLTAGTQPAYGGFDIPVNASRCYVDVNNNFLADSAIDVEAWLMREVAREFARLEAAAFINGVGAKQPQGLLTSGDISYLASGVASALIDGTHNGADALIAMMFQLPAAYAQNGCWLMNRQTMAAVRQLKDASGRYLFDVNSPLDKNGLPTIQGMPVVDCPDMPNIGANLFPIIFGSMSDAYIIVDRAAPWTVIRDPYSQAAANNTRFYFHRRVGGGVALGEALIKPPPFPGRLSHIARPARRLIT
jgi:HK97 family phage major capsid protein